MNITYRIKSVDGNTNFQHVTLKVTPSVEGDYFDMKGNYLGSTANSQKKIYIIGRDYLSKPYSIGTLPENFFDKKASFVGTGNIVNLKAATKYGISVTDLSIPARVNAAENIFNHYYKEAGFDLNELKYKTITNAFDLNRHLSKEEIKRRDDKYTPGRREQLEGTGFAITRVGGYADFCDYLKNLEVEISIGYTHLGDNFDTGYDIMSVCGHEHKHLEDCINDIKNNTRINSEKRAYEYQTKVDKNWKLTSFRFKAGLRKLSPAFQLLSKEDAMEAFGDEEQYRGFDPFEAHGKNITL